MWNVPRKKQHVELSKLVLFKEQRKATVVDNGDIRKGNDAVRLEKETADRSQKKSFELIKQFGSCQISFSLLIIALFM